MQAIKLITDINNGHYLSQRYQQRIKEDEAYSFYEFIKEELKNYENRIKDLDEKELTEILKNSGSFIGNPTKNRFLNLMKRIDKYVMDILEHCYRGDLLNAMLTLIKLLGYKDPKIKRYLDEDYINKFSFNLKEGETYYRVRDFKDGDYIDNCYHIPYHIRGYANNGRYSISGFPCLYLADNLEAACKEVGEKAKDTTRYYSEYKIKKKEILNLLDFSLKDKKDIEGMNQYDLLCELITFPLKLTCIIKTKYNNCTNHEEYFIPQLISHCLLYGHTEQVFTNYQGIKYTSTKDYQSASIAIPARFNPKEEIKFTGYCKSILSKFDITKPTKTDK